MKDFRIFFIKELSESVKTYKALILGAVFVILGMMSPLLAKLMPEILSMGLSELKLELPQPTALDAWTQFFKNTDQIGILAMVILFAGILSSEITKGTLINLLTKGLSRTAVILSKYSAIVCLWSVCYGISFALNWGYTVWLFPQNTVDGKNVLCGGVCLWMFGVFLLAVLILGASLFRSIYGCLLFTGFAAALGIFLNLLPQRSWSPFACLAYPAELACGTLAAADACGALAAAAAGAMALAGLSILIFRKKSL